MAADYPYHDANAACIVSSTLRCHLWTTRVSSFLMHFQLLGAITLNYEHFAADAIAYNAAKNLDVSVRDLF